MAWGVGLGEMCVIDYNTVWFTHCLVYLVVSNTDSSTLGSSHFWDFRVYNACSWIFIVTLLI